MNTLTDYREKHFFTNSSIYLSKVIFVLLKLIHVQKKQSDFTFDLEAMKKAINSPKSKVPKSALESDENFEKWLNE